MLVFKQPDSNTERMKEILMYKINWKISMKIFGIITLLFTLITSELFAENLYISPTGSGDGSRGKPWGIADFNNSSNWGSGVGKISPGDTVLFMDGTYTAPSGDYIIRARRSGTAGNQITLKAQNYQQAILDCKDNRPFGIFINQKNYISIEDFEITRCNVHIYVRDDKTNGGTDVHDIEIRGNYFNGSGDSCKSGSGIIASSSAHDIVIENNEFDNIGIRSNCNTGCHGHGIYLVGYNNIIRNNVFLPRSPNGHYHIKIDGYDDAARGKQSALIINNTFYGSGVGSCNLPHITRSHSHGVRSPGPAVIQDNIFYNPGNLIRQATVVRHSGTLDGWVFKNNVTNGDRYYISGTPTDINNLTASDGVTEDMLKKELGTGTGSGSQENTDVLSPPTGLIVID
jgi:hypothetical protein